MGTVDFLAGQVHVHVTLDTHLPNGQGFPDKLSSHQESKCKSRQVILSLQVQNHHLTRGRSGPGQAKCGSRWRKGCAGIQVGLFSLRPIIICSSTLLFTVYMYTLISDKKHCLAQ